VRDEESIGVEMIRKRGKRESQTNGFTTRTPA
jgi:hypothetical protein